MESAFPWLVILAVGATLAVLIFGVLTMLRGGGAADARRSNLLMRYRILFQATAVALIAVAFLVGRCDGVSP